MSREADFIGRLRTLATDPAARGLLDDAAVLGDLVLTTDMIAEGIHFRADDPPEDIAWKLVAVNLSDLAAKGATPLGVLLSYPLGEPNWDARFVKGLGEVLRAFDTPLLGGDTIALRPTAPRCFSLTAIGRASPGGAPSRAGAGAGDALWVTGVIGAAGLGLAGDPAHLDAYRRPRPLLAEGRVLAPMVNAMMDVSDGLLIDAARMAEASGCAVTIELGAVPYARGAEIDRDKRLAAVTAGDDYQLLFALSPGAIPPTQATRIGSFSTGTGLMLAEGGAPVALPISLGWQH